MRKSFLYRLYPNKVQSDKLAGMVNAARHLYNAALQERRDAYRMQHKSLNYFDQSDELKGLRQEFPEIAELNCSAAQDMLRRLDKSFKAFFRRIKHGEKPGFPRFKGYNRFNSITFPTYGDGIKMKDNRLYVRNAGLIKIKVHRSLEGEINTVTIKRDGDKWYAVFSNTVDIKPLPVSDREIGIDVGLESFAVTSGNEYIENPHCLKRNLRRLRVIQRSVSRKKLGGRNRKKAVKILASMHRKIKNQRKEFHHYTANRIVKSYGYIAAEKLQIDNMLGNHHLAQSISDVGWGQFMSILSYKAEYAGRVFTQVNPNGTSQVCSSCGTKVPKDLSIRIHHCPVCGISLNRDYNAALNILTLGRSVWDVTWNRGSCVSQEAVCFS